MMRKPLVSILMNCHNCLKYVEYAIDSIYGQTYQNWEIVFIDNRSTDDIASLLKKYDSRIHYFKTEKFLSLGEARNYGLEFCKGDYLAFLDADDIWLPYKLTMQIEFMERYTDYQMIYGGFEAINEDGDSLKVSLPKFPNGNIFPYLLVKNEINMQTVLIRRNIDISFREDLSFSPDYNLFLKIAAKYPIASLKKVLVKYRIHQHSLTRRTKEKWGIEKELTLKEVMHLYPELNNTYRREFKLGLAYADQLKAKYYIESGKKQEALKLLSKHKFLKPSYFVLFLLGLLPKPLWDYVHEKIFVR